jgi:hypothetical protein
VVVIAWIYNYICNRCLLSLMLWVRLTLRVRCTKLCDKVCQWLTAVRWLSQGTPVSVVCVLVFSYIIDHCYFILIFNRLKAYRRFDSKIKYFQWVISLTAGQHIPGQTWPPRYVYVIWKWIDWYRKYQPVEPDYEVWWQVTEANESQTSYSVEQADILW